MLATSSFRFLPRWTSCVALETIHHCDNHVHHLQLLLESIIIRRNAAVSPGPCFMHIGCLRVLCEESAKYEGYGIAHAYCSRVFQQAI